MDNSKNLIFLLLILIILIPAGFIVGRSMKSDTIKTSLSEDKLLKILFIIEYEGKPLSTNIIAHYPQTRRAAMFDIPGTIGLILPQLGRTDAISALYTEKGPEAYKAEIEKLTGIDIPFYIQCDLSAFAQLIDFLDGISVFIPTPIDFDSEQYGKILLPSGSVLLDGDKVCNYVLYETDNDIEGEAVIRRQKAILAFFRSINEHPLFFEKTRFSLFSSFLHSNISGEDFKRLLEYISHLDTERLVPQRLTGAIRIVDEKQLLFPFREGQQIKEIMGQTLATLASEEGEAIERVYALEILNGTETNGLARTVSELYQSFGYDVITIGNAQKSNIEHTVLIDRIGNPSVARLVAQVIKCQNIESTPIGSDGFGNETNVDFTLILGKDFNGYFVKPKK